MWRSSRSARGYTLLLNEEGGMIDDLIVYRIDADKFLLVVNARNRRRFRLDAGALAGINDPGYKRAA